MKILLKAIAMMATIATKLWPYKLAGYAKYIAGEFYSQWVCRSLHFDTSNHFGRRLVVSGRESVVMGKGNSFGHDMMISVWGGVQIESRTRRKSLVGNR